MHLRVHFQVALKQSPLEPKDMFYRKQELTEIFHIYVTCFILRFLLRTFFKTVGEPLYLLTVHPKLIFRGALKKALMVLEDWFYQRQYFAKIFPSPLTLTLQIHLHRSLSGITLNCALNAIALKSATFSAPQSVPETNIELANN